MDKKFIALIIVLSAGIIGIAVLVSNSSPASNTKASISKTTGAKIVVDHFSKKVGNIPYSGGDLIYVFSFQKTRTKDF